MSLAILSLIRETNPPFLLPVVISLSPNSQVLNFSLLVAYPIVEPIILFIRIEKGPATNPARAPALIPGILDLIVSLICLLNAWILLPLKLPSLSVVPNNICCVFSEEFTNPIVEPTIAPAIGEPIKSPAPPPNKAPLPILGNLFCINLITFSFVITPPECLPSLSSLPNKASCTRSEEHTSELQSPDH